MLTIGNIKLNNKVFLAPMAGVTDLAFRLICKKWGAGLVFSEMVSAKALHYNDKKTLELLQTHSNEAPLAVQIFGSDPDIMAESAKKIQDMGFKLLDINFGCPAPKIVKSGDGSALLNNPELMGKITSAVTSAVSIPVMCKIRCGFDDFVDVAYISKILEQSGAAAITVHGRTRKMFYSGVADRSKIRLVKESISVPVIGNGDITSGKSAANMFETTNCDAVMIGRGSQGNPFIFKEINDYLKYGKAENAYSNSQKLEFMKEHINLLISLKGEHLGILEARKHIAWYTKGMHAGATFRTEVFKTNSFQKLTENIENYISFIKEREDSNEEIN